MAEEKGNEKLRRTPDFETPRSAENSVQLKCAECEEEQLQQKEDKNSEALKENLQRKPIFERNENKSVQQKNEPAAKNLLNSVIHNEVKHLPATSSSTLTSIVQPKCAACEHEEKPQQKEEEKKKM